MSTSPGQSPTGPASSPISSAAARDGALDHWRESAARAAGAAYEAAYGREIQDASAAMRWRIEPRVAVAIVMAVATLGGIAWWLTRADAPVEPVALPTPSTTALAVPLSSTASPVRTPLVVHVSGAVATPGLVEVDASARVADAVESAGGVLPDADLSGVNLARTAVDGEHIHVPSTDGESSGDAPINLNAASAEELQRLPGVGEVTAHKIVADRDAHGPFGSVDDVQRVSGVGPAMVAGWEGLAQV